MPFDGIVLKSIVYELKDKLVGGRIEKVYQPEIDEIILNIRGNGNSYKLLLSSNPSLPRVHITSNRKENPALAPNFCMVLRKHVQGAKIIDINSFGFERILAIDIEAYNELHDKLTKRILVEIMGKHSNIILINEKNRIIDAIKHIDADISSFREVMPARSYVLPPVQNKLEPDLIDVDSLFTGKFDLQKKASLFLVDSIMGFSPFIARNLCILAEIDAKTPVSELTNPQLNSLKQTIQKFFRKISSSSFTPCIIFKEDDTKTPMDFYCMDFPFYKNVKYLNSINEIVDEFYYKKDFYERLHSKKSELLKSINNAMERIVRKINIYNDNLVEVKDREKYKLYGDLILSFIHSIPKNADKVTLTNFYSENCEDLEIPLEPTLPPQATASRYYKKYSKAKNTFDNCSKLLEEVKIEFSYLENVQFTLESSETADEINQIRQELIETGVLNNNRFKKIFKKTLPSFNPQCFKSSDGYTIYVGRNNFQNDKLTLKESRANDMWLHTKEIAGSHVIIKKQKDDIPESTIFEAAMLAAFFSKGKLSSKVPVDYTLVKYVKKPPGSKPGMVTYTNQKTLFVTPEQCLVEKLKYDDKDVK